MSGYELTHEPISPAVYAARIALMEGLRLLRTSMTDMLSLGVRGDGGAKRTRTRPHTNEAPTRHAPAGNGRRINGRPSGPARPTMPAQHGSGDRPANVPHMPAPSDTDTVVLPVVPVDAEPADPDRLAGGPSSGPPGRAPSGHPDRPDPSHAAAQAWSLVERAQGGDVEAFGLIYDRYVDTVFRFVYFRVGHRQLAEDLTSETFLRALRSIGRFTWQGRDPGAWLVTIARNLVADHFKSGKYRLEVTTGDVLDADSEDRGPEGSPEAAVVDHITNVALLTAVKRLNPEQQECIVLRFLQGFSVAETAQAMGKNEGAIKALQYRAVRALARLLPEGLQP